MVQLAVMAVVVVCIIVFGKADAMDMFLSDVIIIGLFFRCLPENTNLSSSR